jgi:hypothetical protein
MKKLFAALFLALIAFPASAQVAAQFGLDQVETSGCRRFAIRDPFRAATDKSVRLGCMTSDGVMLSGNQVAAQRSTHGYYENAAVAWAIANEPNGRPQVNGFTTDSGLASYADRDSVAFFASNYAPAPTQTVAASSFTTTTVALGAAANASVQIGMVVDTTDATKFSGRITAISTNRLTLTVSGWYQMGNTAAGQVPAGSSVVINPITKVWALNANATLNSSSYANRAVVAELGIVNNKGALTYGDGGSGPGGGTNQIGGIDVTSLGAYPGAFGYIARGDILRGFISRGNGQYGFVVEDGTQNPAVSFVSEATGGLPFSARPGGIKVWEVDRLGGMDLGNQSSAIAPVIRFYSGGTSTATARLSVDTGGNLFQTSTGVACIKALTACGDEALRVASVASQTNSVLVTGAAAGGTPSVLARGSDANVPLQIGGKGTGAVLVSSTMRPPTNQVYDLGSTAFRWKELFLSGPIARNVTLVTTGASYVANGNDSLIVVRKATGSATAITLPASPAPGQEAIVKDGKGDAATNPITITSASGMIDGGASYVISANRGAARLTFDGTEWVVF